MRMDDKTRKSVFLDINTVLNELGGVHQALKIGLKEAFLLQVVLQEYSTGMCIRPVKPDRGDNRPINIQ